MKNAVERMFDLALLEPLKYFPKHATCPEKFWEIIEKIESETGQEVCIASWAKRPTKHQIEIAKEFNSKFRKLIVQNPTNDFIVKLDSLAAEEIKAIMKDYEAFEASIKSLFQSAVVDLMKHRR